MSERIFYVLAYDITSDKRRLKIARLMESMGVRVQGSVFEAYMEAAELEKVVKKALRVLDEKEDTLRIYFVCEACRAKVRTLGKGEVTPPPGLMIV